MLQKRSHRKHISRSEGLQRGPIGKTRRLTGIDNVDTKIRVGKSIKQLRSNERIKLRKDMAVN